MRAFFLLIFLITTCLLSFGQFPMPIDSVYTFIKFNSIHRKSVDWTQLDKNFHNEIRTAKTLNDTMSCFVNVLRSLNDVHSQIYLNNEYYGHYPKFEDSVLVWLKPLNDKANSATNEIQSKILNNKIGYLRVPGFQVYAPRQINDFAQSLADTISNMSQECSNGYIIDLRLNSGGNIYPMLSGLSQFLGNQTIGYEIDADDHIVRSWEIKNGNFILGGFQTTNIKVKSEATLSGVPIVVLIGPVTKSAGSMVAIAFKGRPQTLFIGRPTADGYTTSNGYFAFAPNLTLNFATHFVADRNKNVYKTTVDPDIVIEQGTNFENIPDDDQIKTAMQWLIGKK